jgi:mannose-1-phosphate guanylyltransferase
MRIVPVILYGGAGTRLWPVSRESMPKQFVQLIGDRSTFQQTLARVSDPDLFDRAIVITNGDFRFIVAEQLRELGIEADIVLEPSRRDSGPAVAVAAALAARRDPDATVLVLAADHVVRKTQEFHAACRSAAAAAATGLIVTFGIRPTSPATSYGYIRPGAKLNGAATLAVEAFVEKPDAATAARYLAENYLWNSGNFTFRADVMLDEIAFRARDGGRGARYQVKRIMVTPGARLSLQKHFHRAEHWVVVTGTAEVTVGDKVYTKHENESVYIPIGSVHRLANPGKIALELIEVQVGAYLGEDDIVRLDDVYGRG